MKVTIEELEAYLFDHYGDYGENQGLFMKLVKEIGETAEVLNKKAGYKAIDNHDLKVQLGNELADMIHYTAAIAAINHIDLNQVILDKDHAASIKYNHRVNLEQFIVEMRNKK